jgi:hypothetical protein
VEILVFINDIFGSADSDKIMTKIRLIIQTVPHPVLGLPKLVWLLLDDLQE